jgi:HK97 family phage portal protein
MSKFTEKAKTILKNLGELAIDKYRDAVLITSQIYNDGFTYFNYSFKKLIKEGYASNTDVYSIISKIIRTGANIPYYIVKINPDGTEEEVTSGPFYESVMKPNKRQNKFEFTEDALGYQLTTGNELLTGLVPAGFKMITQVNIIPPQLVTVKIMGKQLFDYTMKYIVKWRGVDTTFEEEDVKHIKYFNPTTEGLESGMGLSPLQAAYQTLSASNELMYAGASALKNRGANGLLSADGDRPMDAEESDDLQRTVNDKLGGGEKFNRVVATTANVKYTQFGLSPADLKMIENGVLTLRQLCSIYGADSSSFNDPANKKFNNLKEAQKSFYVNAVLPPLERHLAGYKELILPGWNEQDNTTYDIRLDLSKIDALQSDQAIKTQRQVNLSTGIANILMRVAEKKMGRQSAINLLVMSFDLSPEEAEELVSDTGVTETNNPDPNA